MKKTTLLQIGALIVLLLYGVYATTGPGGAQPAPVAGSCAPAKTCLR